MEYGDLVVYVKSYSAHIGKYVRRTEDNKIAIVPMTGGIVTFRKKNQVVLLKRFLERNGYEIKKTAKH